MKLYLFSIEKWERAKGEEKEDPLAFMQLNNNTFLSLEPFPLLFTKGPNIYFFPVNNNTLLATNIHNVWVHNILTVMTQSIINCYWSLLTCLNHIYSVELQCICHPVRTEYVVMTMIDMISGFTDLVVYWKRHIQTTFTHIMSIVRNEVKLESWLCI